MRNQASYCLTDGEIESVIGAVRDLENLDNVTALMGTLAGARA